MATLQRDLELAPPTKIIVVTGQHDRDNAVRAVPSAPTISTRSRSIPTCCGCSSARLPHPRARGAEPRAARGAARQPLEGLIATDDAMLKVCRMIEKVAPTRRVGADARRERHRQGTAGARRAHAEPARERAISSRSTARRFPSSCSRASCSATRRARSPARSSRRSASSRPPTAARCSSTRSATCRWRCRRSCCASCRTA